MSSTNDTINAEPGEDSKDIVAQARAHYELCVQADTDNRTSAEEDLLFLSGGVNQWDQPAVAMRRADGRPVITVNMLPAFLHQVTNDQRMNTPAIKVHPVGDLADVETAKVRQGMIRHIEYDSNADIAYDRSVNSAAAVGFGYWYLDLEYESENSFNQKIMYRSVRNCLSVRIDPLSVEPDGSDMNFAFIECLMSREDYKREYPKGEANDQTLISGDNPYSLWMTDKTVLVTNYYCIKRTKETVIELSNGETGFKRDLIALPPGVEITRERPGMRSKVMLYKIGGGIDLLEQTEIKCKWIPVFPVYGDEIDIKGKVIRKGIIRDARGPQQSYNVMMSAATEEVALRSKAPWVGAVGQFEGMEDEWEQSNNRAFPFLEYNPVSVEGVLAPPPQRQPMADIPSGMLSMAMHASDNVKKTTGLFDASLGARGSATSGKQELAQQREGDMANYHYMDGLLRTQLHCGRCINDMIPHYYDGERIARVMREDDTVEYTPINKVVQGPMEGAKPRVNPETGAIEFILNDMTGGEFDVTISSGPSYSTLRQEAAEGMAQNMAKNPALWGVIGDLYVKNQDWPGADAMAERIKKTIPPQLLEDEENENQNVIQTPKGPIPIDKVPQVLAHMDQQLAQASEIIEKSDADKNAAEVMKQQNEQASLMIERERLSIEQFNAETERAKVHAEAQKAEAEAAQAEANLLMTYQQQQIEAREAEMQAVSGDSTAFEAWKATLEADTKIRVAQIMAASRQKAQSQPR